MAVTDPEVLARQAAIRANISKATNAQFDAGGNNTRAADSWYALKGQTPPPAQNQPNTPTTVTSPAPSGGGSYSQPAAYQSSYQGPDIAGMESKLNQAAEARKASELAAIRQQRETAMQGYNKMETGTKQMAYDNRNQADAVSMQNAARLRQSMADMGLINSGDNLTAQAQGNAQRQGAIGSINRDESSRLGDIGERRTLLQNQAAEQESALIQRIEAERMMQLMQLQQYGDQSAMNWDNQNYGRYRDTIGDQFNRDQLDWQKILDAANQTGYFNGKPAWWNGG